jgi:hypothetical protein
MVIGGVDAAAMITMIDAAGIVTAGVETGTEFPSRVGSILVAAMSVV